MPKPYEEGKCKIYECTTHQHSGHETWGRTKIAPSFLSIDEHIRLAVYALSHARSF